MHATGHADVRRSGSRAASSTLGLIYAVGCELRTMPKYGSASRQENDTSKCEASHHLDGRLGVGQRGSHLTLKR